MQEPTIKIYRSDIQAYLERETELSAVGIELVLKHLENNTELCFGHFVDCLREAPFEEWVKKKNLSALLESWCKTESINSIKDNKEEMTKFCERAEDFFGTSWRDDCFLYGDADSGNFTVVWLENW